MPSKRKLNREAWLTNYAAMLRPLFKKHGYKIPEHYAAIGSMRPRALGLAYSGTNGRKPELYVANHTKRADIGHVLVHELCHAVVGNDAKHGPRFRACAEAVGLTGKMTSTHPTPELAEYLATIEAELPPYPGQADSHSDFFGRFPKPGEKKTVSKKGQRDIKLFCPGCKSVVTMKFKTWERGVKVTCNNESCEMLGEEFQRDPD